MAFGYPPELEAPLGGEGPAGHETAPTSPPLELAPLKACFNKHAMFL